MSSKLCSCGCDTFRFRVTTEDAEYYTNVCRNCGHTLAEHVDKLNRDAE
jgi:hypothetical protein